MRQITDRCNVCAIERSRANHWLLMVMPANASPYFVRWDDGRAGEDGIGHICGDKCAHQALDEWLNSQHDERITAARLENPQPVAV